MELTVEQKRVLDSFGLGILQDMLNVMNSLELRGISERDVKDVVTQHVANTRVAILEAVAEEKETLAQGKKVYDAQAPQCPACNAPLYIRAIATPKGIQNKEGYKSVWYCLHDDCVYERYSLGGVQAELEEAGVSVSLPGQSAVITGRL